MLHTAIAAGSAGAVLLASLAMAGCTGHIGPGASEGAAGADGAKAPQQDVPADPSTDLAPLRPGPEPVVMRRLTRREYANTVRDLLGAADPTRSFPAEEKVAGYENDAQAISFPPLLAEQVLVAAADLADKAAADATKTETCMRTTRDVACVRTLLGALGLRAWRRPLDPDELDRLVKVHEQAAANDGFDRGVRLALKAMFISPAFLYRIEHGDGRAVAGKPGLVRPTSWEMAARLSYFLWGSMPDDVLLAAARRDELRTDAAIEAQAERMLRDARAAAAIDSFHRQWLELETVASINKDPKVFPTWSDTIAPLLLEETRRFVRDVFETGRPFSELFNGRRSFMNETLAAYLGVPGPSGDEFVEVTLPPGSHRAGLITQGSFLAHKAAFDQSSPTLRGAFVRQRLLCGVLPPPPPEVANTPKPPSATATTRQRYQAHMDNPSCAGCHALMDPIGFGLEGFDGAGLHRSRENGHAVDDTGEVVNTSIGAFRGGVELADKLADSREALACLVRHWYRFTFGREPTTASANALAELERQTVASGGRYRDLVLALTRTDAFRYLPRKEP